VNLGDESKAPLLRVVGGGEPTDEELAALVTAVAMVIATGSRQQPVPSRWAAPAPGLRQPLRPGPGAWKASALPR
jgi:hypothetical protein